MRPLLKAWELAPYLGLTWFPSLPCLKPPKDFYPIRIKSKLLITATRANSLHPSLMCSRSPVPQLTLSLCPAFLLVLRHSRSVLVSGPLYMLPQLSGATCTQHAPPPHLYIVVSFSTYKS